MRSSAPVDRTRDIDRSIRQRLLAHRDPDRHAEQICIGEFLARTLGPVVQKDVEAAARQSSATSTAGSSTSGAPRVERQHMRVVWSDRRAARRCRARRAPAPPSPRSSGRDRSRSTPSARAARRRSRPGRSHRTAPSRCPELEDVADLDRGLESQPPAAHRAGVSLDRTAGCRRNGP